MADTASMCRIFQCHWSPIGSGSDEDNEIYMRYHADDSTRERWFADFGEPLPEKQPLRFPRPWIPEWAPPGFEDEE